YLGAQSTNELSTVRHQGRNGLSRALIGDPTGVFAARRVRCRTSGCRDTHFGFPVGVGAFAKVPGVFSPPPVPVKDSLPGVLTLPASWISLSIALSPSVFLLGQVITSRPGRNDPRVLSTKR